MKNYYSSLQSTNSNVKSIIPFVLVLVLFFMVLVQQAKAQNPYRADSDSHIKISVDSIGDTLNSANSLNAQGNFIIKDGKLDDVNSFNFTMPMHKPTSNQSIKDSISFKLTHVMILPIMKKVHFVGVLNVGGVATRTELFFDFMVNQDQSITLNGDKCIKLSDYNKKTAPGEIALLPDNDDMKLSMKLVFKNELPPVLLSSTGQGGSR